MHSAPASRGPGPDENPGLDEDEPPGPDEEYDDPEHPAMPWDLDVAAIWAETDKLAAEDAADAEDLARRGLLGQLSATDAGIRGRRGPGQPGSARRVPGSSDSPAGGFGAGQPLDVAPGGSALLGFAERVAYDEERLGGATDDEIVGLVCALDRTEASACFLKHAAVAELIRRRPAPGCSLEGEARMPECWEEFAGDEVRWALAETRNEADAMLDLAHALEVKLPGTKEAFRTGVLRRSKVEVIARATRVLDADEARAAEAMVLGRAGRLSPGGLRAAIAHAVIEVAPDKARKRREDAVRDARVERWPEDSGNAALAGRELPPAEVLAADQRITWWARQLRAAGLAGSMDELRARAYLDLLLDTDSRPATPDGAAAEAGGGSAPPGPAGSWTPPGSGVIPAGFTGRNHLTIPLATLLELADRPGEITGLGPIDPWLARDLARTSAASPKTTWCLTVTDDKGHAIGHGCARPERGKPPRGRCGQRGAGPPGGHDPPAEPGFTFTPADADGPPGGYGSWRFSTGIRGQPAQLIMIDPIAIDTCDHRFAAAGHDPGVKLRHLSQVRHAFCTGPMCRRPSVRADFEHNTPYDQGGLSCLCNGGPKCRHEHRLKQDPRWTVEQPTPATFRWTTPSGRPYLTEPTRYPI
ncbi:MAG: DUF222 domain-containing protein [Streptosporangiaceae bacterium]